MGLGKGQVSQGSVPFQVVQLKGDRGLDSRFRGNDGLSAAYHLNWNAIVSQGYSKGID